MTDTEKWRDRWFQALTPSHKLAYIYLCDNCDNAGVFDPNLSLAEFCIGTPVNWDALIACSEGRIQRIDKGKWWLSKLIAFQFGELSEASPVHRSVLRLLQGHSLLKAYKKGIYSLQDKDKDKDKDKAKDLKGGAGGILAEDIYAAYPRKQAKQDALRAIAKAMEHATAEHLLAATKAYAEATALWSDKDREFIPYPATWFNRGSYDDDPATWRKGGAAALDPEFNKF